MLNTNQLCGIILNIKYGTNNQTAYLDFVLKIRRDESEIYDLLDCSVYGKKAERLYKEAKEGDIVIVTGEYRSSKIIANGKLQEKYSYFLINKYKILKEKKLA